MNVGLFTILVPQNKLQKNLLFFWKSINCSLIANQSIKCLVENIKLTLNSNKLRYSMAKRGIKEIDGKGPERIVKYIEKLI